jgi:hypothetical protein
VDTLELVFEIVFFTLAIPAFIADVLAGVSERADCWWYSRRLSE